MAGLVYDEIEGADLKMNGMLGDIFDRKDGKVLMMCGRLCSIGVVMV